MNREELIDKALLLPSNAISYYVSRQLERLFPDKELRECESGYFDVVAYAESKHCTIASHITKDSEFLTDWDEPDEEEQVFSAEGQLKHSAYNAWLEVSWQEETLTI